MQSNLLVIGMLAGGVGLFLLAVGMITDGLKLAAGSKLRSILGSWTRTPRHGIATGFFITAIVQSSSAITVATIGFVNAGILTLNQALGIVFGANIGTTITGWLVAIIGFEINISALALPIIGIGMLMRLTGGHSRWAAVGTALAGFGLFFIGITVLKDAFESMVATLDMQRYTLQGVGGLLLYLGIGFLMTVLTQSSSAAIAITITAATGGLLGPYAAGAMIIGANVGTTSTAIISVIGATANAKRVAAAHVLFNLVTAVVALVLLPFMFFVVNGIASLMNLEQIPSLTLALFHTVFNVLGVLLVLPFTDRLASELAKRFTSQEEILGRPRYLDKTVLVTPSLALNAIMMEQRHLAELDHGLCKAAVKPESMKAHDFSACHTALVKLVMEIGGFVMQLQRTAIPLEVAEALPRVLRVNQYFLTAAELAVEIRSEHQEIGKLPDAEMRNARDTFHDAVFDMIKAADPGSESFSNTVMDEKLAQLQLQYENLKAANLQRSVITNMAVEKISVLLEQESNIRRMAVQLSKASAHLSALAGKIGSEAESPPQQESTQDQAA